MNVNVGMLRTKSHFTDFFFLSPFFFHVSTELRSQMFLRVENIQGTQNALRSLEVPKILQLLQIVLSSSYCNTSTKAEHD